MNKTSEANIDKVKETADKATVIGEVKQAFLTEAQFQSQVGSNWILCDGRDVTGSAYEVLTGNTSVPDLRGQFLRGLDNMRGIDVGRTIGSEQEDELKAHSHGISPNYGSGTDDWCLHYDSTSVPKEPGHMTVEGGDETRPKNVAVNFFIRIN